MTIGKKLTGGFAIVLVLLAIATLVAINALRQTRTTYDTFLDVDARQVNYADALRFELRDQIAHYRAALLYQNSRKHYLDRLQDDYRSFRGALEKMRGLARTRIGQGMLSEIEALQIRHEQAQGRVIDLAQRGKHAEAIALGVKEVTPLTDTLLDKVDQFLDRQVKLVAEGRARLAAEVGFFMTTMVAVALLAFVIGMAIAFYLNRAITRQLGETIAQLSSSAAEILATTTQVASGAAETATAVSETTATVEEVKQTAQVASQKARYVSDSAQKVAQVSQAGRKSVEDAIAGMHRIQEQMESIAESIVRLSEQSQAIGEIIATVNDLAEQSNVLAVNAAIEATRAGEQGKGFGVVAQEVKSLAEQSKQATAQVRAILGDIQKATSAAVLATEQGHKAVEAGVKQSAEASDAISQLTESVNEAAQAATQIAASSQQQMVGMDQVALAMDNIKQASTQNVAGTRQAEVAAQSLHELGVKLKLLAEQYRV
jgi:methyl-accepting chemotaxis protein